MPSQAPLAPGRLTVSGCPEGFDARHLAATIDRAEGPVVHVVRDDTRLAALAASLRFFAPGLPVLRFPAWDCLPYDRISPNPEIAAARMATLAALAGGFDRPAAVLTTLNAATQRVPAREVIVLGGGGRSRLWLQIRADALGLPHRTPAHTDTCPIGAAMLALVALGHYPDVRAAAAQVPGHSQPVVPAGSLDDAYARYRRLVTALGPLADQPWA
jgi:glycerol kinase